VEGDLPSLNRLDFDRSTLLFVGPDDAPLGAETLLRSWTAHGSGVFDMYPLLYDASFTGNGFATIRVTVAEPR
jgi:hypothetical protein